MKSWFPISVAAAMVVFAAHSDGQDRPGDHVLSTILQTEADAIHREHPKARLFQVAIIDFIPAAIGVDCSASMRIGGGFLSENDIRYHEVSGQFSACEGSQKSSLHISLRTFRTVPCKARYAEEESIKSCGGPLDEPEPEELHHPLDVSVGLLVKIIDILREKGVDLTYRYDLQITTAARIASKADEFGIPASSKPALFKFRSAKPDAAVVLIRGRQSKSGSGDITFALVDAQTASIIDIGHSTPLNLLPPTRPQ
jgi:hypothetical protein